MDKRPRTWVTPMPALATDALLPAQKKNPAIGAGLLFPSRKNPSRPITSHLAGYWLKRAFEIGTLPKAGRNSLASIPAKVGDGPAAFSVVRMSLRAGGWSDVQTMITFISSPTPRRCALWSTLQNHPTRASGC